MFLRHRRDLPDHQVGRGARDRSKVVMLGEPVADIAELIDMARQIDAVAQRRGGPGAGGDDREVEDGKWDHGANLVWRAGATKTPAVQIRPAIGRVRAGMDPVSSGKDNDIFVNVPTLPTT